MGLIDTMHAAADAADRAAASMTRLAAAKARELADAVRRGQADDLLDALRKKLQ